VACQGGDSPRDSPSPSSRECPDKVASSRAKPWLRAFAPPLAAKRKEGRTRHVPVRIQIFYLQNRQPPVEEFPEYLSRGIAKQAMIDNQPQSTTRNGGLCGRGRRIRTAGRSALCIWFIIKRRAQSPSREIVEQVTQQIAETGDLDPKTDVTQAGRNRAARALLPITSADIRAKWLRSPSKCRAGGTSQSGREAPLRSATPGDAASWAG